jgi:hypothetical protein
MKIKKIAEPSRDLGPLGLDPGPADTSVVAVTERPSPRPDPCLPSLGCCRRGPPSREDMRRRRLRLDVKDGGRCSTAVPPQTSVVVTAVAHLTSTMRTKADGGGDPDRGTDGGGDSDGGR